MTKCSVTVLYLFLKNNAISTIRINCFYFLIRLFLGLNLHELQQAELAVLKNLSTDSQRIENDCQFCTTNVSRCGVFLDAVGGVDNSKNTSATFASETLLSKLDSKILEDLCDIASAESRIASCSCVSEAPSFSKTGVIYNLTGKDAGTCVGRPLDRSLPFVNVVAISTPLEDENFKNHEENNENCQIDEEFNKMYYPAFKGVSLSCPLSFVKTMPVVMQSPGAIATSDQMHTSLAMPIFNAENKIQFETSVDVYMKDCTRKITDCQDRTLPGNIVITGNTLDELLDQQGPCISNMPVKDLFTVDRLDMIPSANFHSQPDLGCVNDVEKIIPSNNETDTIRAEVCIKNTIYNDDAAQTISILKALLDNKDITSAPTLSGMLRSPLMNSVSPEITLLATQHEIFLRTGLKAKHTIENLLEEPLSTPEFCADLQKVLVVAREHAQLGPLILNATKVLQKRQLDIMQTSRQVSVKPEIPPPATCGPSICTTFLDAGSFFKAHPLPVNMNGKNIIDELFPHRNCFNTENSGSTGTTEDAASLAQSGFIYEPHCTLESKFQASSSLGTPELAPLVLDTANVLLTQFSGCQLERLECASLLKDGITPECSSMVQSKLDETTLFLEQCFPTYDRDILLDVLEENRGDVNATVASVLLIFSCNVGEVFPILVKDFPTEMEDQIDILCRVFPNYSRAELTRLFFEADGDLTEAVNLVSMSSLELHVPLKDNPLNSTDIKLVQKNIIDDVNLVFNEAPEKLIDDVYLRIEADEAYARILQGEELDMEGRDVSQLRNYENGKTTLPPVVPSQRTLTKAAKKKTKKKAALVMSLDTNPALQNLFDLFPDVPLEKLSQILSSTATPELAYEYIINGLDELREYDNVAVDEEQDRIKKISLTNVMRQQQIQTENEKVDGMIRERAHASLSLSAMLKVSQLVERYSIHFPASIITDIYLSVDENSVAAEEILLDMLPKNLKIPDADTRGPSRTTTPQPVITIITKGVFSDVPRY